MKAQVAHVEQCSRGLDVDRHLYALECRAAEAGGTVPAFFKDAVRAQCTVSERTRGGGGGAAQSKKKNIKKKKQV